MLHEPSFPNLSKLFFSFLSALLSTVWGWVRNWTAPLSIKCQPALNACRDVKFPIFFVSGWENWRRCKYRLQILRYHTSTPLPQHWSFFVAPRRGCRSVVFKSLRAVKLCSWSFVTQLPTIAKHWNNLSHYCLLEQAFLGMAAATLLLVAMASDAFVTAGPLALPLVCTHRCCVIDIHPVCGFYCTVSKAVQPSVVQKPGPVSIVPRSQCEWKIWG